MKKYSELSQDELIKEKEVPRIWKLLLKEYGKENLKDINIIKKDE